MTGSREAIQKATKQEWIASSLTLLAMTVMAFKRTSSRQPSHRLALEPGADALDHLAVVGAKAFLGDVAEMRRQHDVVELAERMIDRQRLDREHVDRGAGDLLLLQGFQQRGFVDDRPARGVDEVGRRLHACQILTPH